MTAIAGLEKVVPIIDNLGGVKISVGRCRARVCVS